MSARGAGKEQMSPVPSTGSVSQSDTPATPPANAEAAHPAATFPGLAAALDSIEAGFISVDGSGRITEMNALAESLTGLKTGAATLPELLPVLGCRPIGVAERDRAPQDLLASCGIGPNAVCRVLASAGQGARTPLELRVAVAPNAAAPNAEGHNADGPIAGLTLVFRKLPCRSGSGTDSERLAAIVESSSDAIIGKTLDGRITSWNRAAQAIFGYSAEEMIGQSVQRLIPLERQAEERRILEELALGHTVPAFDTVRLARDGRRLDVNISISPIFDGEGRVIGASKIARDISPQRQAEMARIAMQRMEVEHRQILHASRLKSQFLANMSHELRTPLNAVIGFADLLSSGSVAPDSPKHREFLGHIGSSGRHLLQLINDVLDLSKVDSGKFDFHPEPVDLSLVLKEVQDVLHTALLHKRIVLTVQVDPGLTGMMLDAGRLKQVLYNYLSNAIKFSNAGGRVEVRASAEGPEHLRLEVEDHGVGIAPADLPRLFTEFEQLDAGRTRQLQGTGLGLALTARLVRAQGGQVGVRSVLGVGSVFHAVLNRQHGLDTRRAREARQGQSDSML